VKIAQCVEAFVARKRVCGYEYDSSARILRRFAASVGKIDIALVSEEQINLFLTRGQLANHIWRSYRSLIRRFLAYWFARRQIKRIPEPEQKPNTGTRFFPYVYSKAEIARLLAAAPVCQVSRRCTIGSSTLSAIILFLYGTGMRVTEALSLSDSNIDFRTGPDTEANFWTPSKGRGHLQTEQFFASPSAGLASYFCRSLHCGVVSSRLVLREDAAHAYGLHG
jgi:integrase/recombinase XerD